MMDECLELTASIIPRDLAAECGFSTQGKLQTRVTFIGNFSLDYSSGSAWIQIKLKARIRIRICIKIISWTRIRIILQMTS
jgi:hypothetical protein